MSQPPKSARVPAVLPLHVGAIKSMNLEPTPYVTAANVLHGDPAEPCAETFPDGTSRTFSSGDSYVMTKGWAGTFQVDASFTKCFVLHLG